ncbi:ATP-binding protein [Hippea alviniae]|uniref:ATP-binding protein n=1 Tax=Hippea alviniae TaxID=1279027 RepID=UPI0003B41056|nr:ATP-binding protein [Hippea alviniae]
MNTRTFRNEKLIDRDNEINFFLDWFRSLPKLILWVYGPKSSGKTTLIEYVVEKELFEDFENLKPKGNWWVKYINLRRYLISNYSSFIEAILTPEKDDKGKKEEKLSASFNIGVFNIKAELLNEVKNKEKDLFKVLMEEIQNRTKKNRQPIIIIDEIQTLEDIYINGDRELLKEFLNFCVSLTKETHLSHVVILSSNTVFIDRIYNDARLKETSRFYKVDHLPKDITVEWLSSEGFKDDEINLIWDYLGGSIPQIQRLMMFRKEFKTLKEYLEHQAFLAYSQIVMFYHQGKFPKEEIEIFENICKEILNNGSFVLSKDRDSKYLEVISKWAEKEILFFDPLTLEVKGNSRIYEKGMEKLEL